MALLELKQVSKSYQHAKGSLRVLNEISFSVERGEFIAIVGPSGCGKSTLLRIINGIVPPTSGQVLYSGQQVDDINPECAMVFQSFALLPWLSVKANIELGLEARGIAPAERERLVTRYIDKVGLDGFEEAYPRELSGGMRQRVAFLRTLLAEKPVLLLDEPFGALDAITRAELQKWLADALAAEPRTVLLVTHDVEEALLLCERVLVLAGGRMAAELNVHVPRDAPRREVVTSPAFVELRQRALEAIG